MSSENPRKWRFTWEAQSHVPNLRLFIFDSYTMPSVQCQNLKVHLNPSQSLVLVSWFEELEVSLRVPTPRVLVDPESPVSFRAFDDHIEVKLVLLLPVDHPIVSSFDSVLNLSEGRENVVFDALKPLEMDSDLKSLSSSGGVHFYCRSCSFKLTKSPLRHFVEMPSVDWREVADNWFGTCCCSFGGISEKLVTGYAKSYTCAEGICQLSSTTVTLCKDDLVEWKSHDQVECQRSDSGTDINGDNGFGEAGLDSRSQCGGLITCDDPKSDLPKNVASAPGCCDHEESHVLNHVDEDHTHHVSETKETKANQKCLLNGFLGNVFMVRSFNRSVDVEWIEYVCPQCSSLLGAYPYGNGYAPVDSGVRLFKCYISTCTPVGGSGDLFRGYTLERMFTNQLLESAKDESSYRTVVKDVKTKSPLLQIVLLNPNSWSCAGYCVDAEGDTGPVSSMYLHPVIKVLFSDCSNSTESQSRMIEEWETKNLADEVFMLNCQIKELIKSLVSRKDLVPASYSCLQGLSLSSMRR
ncbi:uncharacterized protein LOC132171209 isoform X2 [Corylus avellana]|uniref:uncharacterized protein LOC132171209 isoform X2 n=1 Tax=Corylus avellana TaxID=13451 RepID=UPI00286B79B0|nr:uncharacterized protein LOC132171209 isoform X2 [Corylus avellana]